MSELSDLIDSILTVRKRWPNAVALESDVGGWCIALGLKDGRELAYRNDGDLNQLWKDAAANVNKFDVDTESPAKYWAAAQQAPSPKAVVPKKTWKTKEGQVIPIATMSDKHLTNTISLLERGIVSARKRINDMQAEQQRRIEEAKQLAAQRKKAFAHAPGTRMFRDDE